MAIIKTKRNWVSAYEPLDRDVAVEVLFIPNGSNLRLRLAVAPIDQYQAVVHWAVSIADRFELPIQVVPFDVNDLLSLYTARAERELASMAPDQLFELRPDIACRRSSSAVPQVKES